MAVQKSSDMWLPLLALVLAAASAGMVFVHSLISVRMMVGYEKFCAARLMKRLEGDKDSLRALEQLPGADPALQGLPIWRTHRLRAFQRGFPLGAALVGLPILFYLSVYATLSLLMVVILAFWAQMALRRRAQQVSQDMEDHAVLDKTAKLDFLKAMLAGQATTEEMVDKIPSPLFMDTYRRRLTMPHIGNLAGGLQYGLALAVTIFWFTVFPQDKSTAGNLVLYLFVAMFVLSQMRVAPKVFMNFHVFYNYFSRAFTVIISGRP